MPLPKTSSPSLVPPTRLLVTGRQESTRSLFAKRPDGMADWILIYTEGGRSYYRSAGVEFFARAGDVILIRPGTPHEYGLDESHGYWKDTWTHFLPRPDCLEWLHWPELAPGMMRLHLTGAVRAQVRAELHHMDAAAHGTHRRHEEFAVNALERALLLCDSRNPLHAESHRDDRIRKAMRLLCERPEERFTVETLARKCGLSRSRFAELFSEQAGMPPLVFLEQQRLRRARELLEHTSLNLAEISEQCGFASAFYFSLRFKKQFGASPRDYRKRM
ncbi:MAG: helix-turn-helix domain-containing protein [Chthoniobacteraceae bacterium]